MSILLDPRAVETAQTGDHAHVNVRPTKWSTTCAALASAAALIFIAPASADTTDDAVIATLANQGIVITDRDTTIATAHQVCDGLGNHLKSAVLAVRLVRDTDLSLSQSSYFIGVAMSAYCPQYKGRTGANQSPAGTSD
jgi:Protein of unknown function (DUF732)